MRFIFCTVLAVSTAVAATFHLPNPALSDPLGPKQNTPISHHPKEPLSHPRRHSAPPKPDDPAPVHPTLPEPLLRAKSHKVGYSQRQQQPPSWKLQDTFQGNTFFDGFSFFSQPDPTHGFVNYVDKETAESTGLVQFRDGAVIIKADNHTMAPDGRSSVRISSHHTYESGLFLLDIEHMPIGCGQWPAVWLLGQDWPNGGEIDIVEGTNTQGQNSMTMHTSDGCTQANPHQTGSTMSDNCSANPPNQGCTVRDSSRASFGYRFNRNLGGVFATQWLPDTGFQIWFFQRSDVPVDIRKGQPDPQAWGVPAADFPFDGDHCSQKFFGKLSIIINLTFCGDWAGNPAVYRQSGCPGDCVTFVKNNPDKFDDAYWRIRGIKVYSINK